MRGDVVADGEAHFGRRIVGVGVAAAGLLFGDGGDAEVDGGGVDGDHDVGGEGGEFAADVFEEFEPVAALGEECAGEHGGAVDGVGEEAAAGGGHFIAADADEAGVGEFAEECGDEGCAEGVAGVFGGGEKK